ncbi:zinc finger CCCH domain-containing protein 3-like [Cornus florida]|uniref:zinc finger CCCH domain-containing protein 3-like n=1 Tax=Cornus florida TaxID=4283 RepID=UPI00289EFF11|nr:zinc finger CCCH domain-containing protein 3-like [Cornus florida]
MPENRQVRSNGGLPSSSNPSVNNIEEAIRRLKIQTNDNHHSDAVGYSTPYPDRPGEPDCIYYLRTGLCGYGSNCKFNHPAYTGQDGLCRGELPERVGQPDCEYFLKTGTCKYGSTCKYHHPRDRHGAGTISLNSMGLPMRQEEKPCPYYMRTGLCKFGVACKFHHPQPASAGTVLPVRGPTAFGSAGSSIMPSSGLPYLGGLPAWTPPRAPFLSGPSIQSPQAYMPIVLSPSQGNIPAQGWSTYMGSMSPISSSGVLGPNVVYNSKNQDDSGSGGQLHMLPTSILHLPERPDQPECRYFMSTGNCKYGSYCKYNHPRERISANSLGPLGLPLRPGQSICSYYNLYGLCKYGPTCKFDHPMVYPHYNFNLSFPTLSVMDPSLFAYQRNSSTAHSSETSPSKSSKVPDWSRRLDTASNKSQKPDTKTTRDSSEQPGPSPQSLPASSELPQDQSD